MTILPRAATAGELTKIRSDNQSTRLYLTVHTPATVYSARLAAVPSSTDNVTSVTYNTGSGTYTNILVDQTLYVGTTAGAYDLGMTRIRSLTGLGATSGTFNIGMTSEINWQANAYLTVVDEFALFPRWPVTDSGGTIYMDVDVAYSDQHRYCLSFPIFPRYSVKWLTGATVNVVRDGSQSWALNNTINSYAWTAPGSSALSGATTNTATITYNAKSATAGYRVGLTVGNTDGVSFAGYGRVFVLADESDAITEFTIDSLSGSYQSGGWSAQVTCYAQADRSTIRDRALCIIHRRDWYGPQDTDEGSIGYVADDENIELIGWIAGESIKWATEDQAGAVTFTIQGPQWWLNQMTMPTVGLKNSTTTPVKWNKFQGLTAKSATWHILMWRTTAPRMMDCFSIENGWAALQLQSGGAQTVWSQISNILNDFLIARPCCDAYARLFMQIEQNCLSAADRSSIPSVLTVTTADWMNEISFDRRVVNDVAAVDLEGDVYDGSTNTSLYALSPGRTFSYRGGSIFTREKLTIDTQATLNALAAAVYGWKNNPYPNWRFQFPSNLHLIDLAPYQYLTISVASGDTPRGFVHSNLRLIPREIRRAYRDGYITAEVTVEAESTIGIGLTGDTPSAPPTPPVSPPPPPPPPPPPVPIPSGNAKETWFATSNAIYWCGDYFLGGDPTWNKVASLPAVTLERFEVSSDGSIVYVQGTAGGTKSIWSCVNPKAASPVWNNIATTGDTIGGYVITVDSNIRINNTTLVTLFLRASTGYRYYAEYNGSAWTLTQAANDYGTQTVYAYELTIHSAGGDLYWLIATKPYGFVSAWAGASGGYWSIAWRNQIGGDIYIVATSATSGNDIRNVTDASIALNLPFPSGAPNNYTVSGAVEGPQVYVTGYAGALYLSDDGASFAATGAGWSPGWVHDAKSTGGGSLVWVLKSIASSNVPTRIYNRDGTVLRDMTGNFWTLTSGDQTVVGSGLVY